MASAARASEWVSCGYFAEGAGAGEINHDGEGEDEEGPGAEGEREVIVEDDAVDGLVDDPDGGGEHEAGFDEGGEGLNLAVAVVVVVVGGAVCDLDGEEGDGGGDEVDAGVGRPPTACRGSR